MFLAAILLFSSTANADSKIWGHTDPLPEEMLANPIHLECGAEIKEWRGSPVDSQTVNSLCTFTKNRFYSFYEAKGISIKNPAPFRYSLSFIPVTSRYRDLNDSQYRFAGRTTSFKISGYTLNDVRYVFNISNTYDPQFNVSLVHELFHALSFHHGVNGPYDEDFAEEFTMKYMGLK